MTKAEPPPIPTCDMDAESAKRAFANVESALHDRDYRRTTECASTAIAKIQHSLMAMLDIKAYALSMQGKFEEAIKYARTVIESEPTSAIGYIRLAEIYRTQGNQQNAIDTYNIGLQSVSSDHPDYARMIYGKEAAVKQNETRIDFVAILPVEIIDDIISLLSKDGKATCLTVSSVWRDTIVKCSDAWRTLTANQSTADRQVSRVLPHIANHVEDLAFNTVGMRTFSRYLATMNMGSFGKIKSLKLDENTSRHIDLTTIMPMTNAFWRIRSTLTRLVLHLGNSGSGIPLIDLLSVCSNLVSLEYSTSRRLSVGEDHGPVYQNALVSMDLQAELITYEDITKLLPHCQRLRSLILTRCNDDSILGFVVNNCPSLRTFGYNPDRDRIEKHAEQPIHGLRHFYTSDGGAPENATAVLPPIQRNMPTLETLYVNFFQFKFFLPNVSPVYPRLELPNLKSLTYWGYSSIQPLLLRSISTCTMLTHVAAVESNDITGLVTVLEALPQLESLEISYTRTSIGEQDLARLFQKYARDRQSIRRLKTVWIRYCNKDIVTDNVLTALSSINTLENIWFAGLPNISYRELSAFLTASDSISDVRLTDMDSCFRSGRRYTFPFSLGNAKNLKSLRLENMKYVTDGVIVNLVDQASTLQSLTVKNCKSVTQIAIAHAKKTVKNVFVE